MTKTNKSNNVEYRQQPDLPCCYNCKFSETWAYDGGLMCYNKEAIISYYDEDYNYEESDFIIVNETAICNRYENEKNT